MEIEGRIFFFFCEKVQSISGCFFFVILIGDIFAIFSAWMFVRNSEKIVIRVIHDLYSKKFFVGEKNTTNLVNEKEKERDKNRRITQVYIYTGIILSSRPKGQTAFFRPRTLFHSFFLNVMFLVRITG